MRPAPITAIFSVIVMSSQACQGLHDSPQILLRLEADAGDVGHTDIAVLDRHAVGEAAERREDIGVGFIAAKAKPDGDVEGELVAAMRHAAPPRPARL